MLGGNTNHGKADFFANTLDGDDVLILGSSASAWVIVRSTILLAPEFSDELKKWAETVPEVFSPDEVGKMSVVRMELMREWWRENRAAFRTGEYSKVKPGPILPEWKADAPAEKTNFPDPLLLLAKPNTHETKQVPQIVATPAEDKPRVWPWFAGIAALLASVALILKRKTSKPH